MTNIILFKTSRGFMMSPIFEGHSEIYLDNYEKAVRQNYSNIEYSKRFASLEILKRYIKEQLGLSQQEFEKQFGRLRYDDSIKQIEDTTPTYPTHSPNNNAFNSD